MKTQVQPQTANILSVRFMKSDDEKSLLKRLKKTQVIFKNKTIKHC